MTSIGGDRLAQLQEAIDRAPEALKREFDSTPNDWLHCFGSRIFVIDTHLESERAKKHFSPQEHAAARERLAQLKDRVRALKEQYVGKMNIPPDALQKELFAELDVVRGLV